MTAEEAFAEAYAELEQIQAIDHNGEPVMKLRIQLADEPPKETSVVGVAWITALFWIGLWAGLRAITFLIGRFL